MALFKLDWINTAVAAAKNVSGQLASYRIASTSQHTGATNTWNTSGMTPANPLDKTANTAQFTGLENVKYQVKVETLCGTGSTAMNTTGVLEGLVFGCIKPVILVTDNNILWDFNFTGTDISKVRIMITKTAGGNTTTAFPSNFLQRTGAHLQIPLLKTDYSTVYKLYISFFAVLNGVETQGPECPVYTATTGIYIAPIPICLPVSFDNVTVLPNAVTGTTYNHGRILNGTAPFTISRLLTKPSWMNVTVEGNVLQFTGTPVLADVVNNIAVILDVSNNCGINSLNTLLNVTTAVPPCRPISAPYLISNNIQNAVCPYDLTSLAGASVGYNIEWHTQNNTNVGTLVSTPTAVSDGTYYAFIIQNVTGCVSPSSSVTITCAVAPACVPVDFLVTPTMPDAAEDQLYSFTRTLTGTAPFTLTGVTKPSWMTIAVVGSSLNFKGTPVFGNITPSTNIAFVVNNACGTKGTSGLIAVTAAPVTCVNVALLTPSVPNPVIGQAYNGVINLSGTAPFNISTVVKPAWMSITSVGNGYLLSGTPTVVEVFTLSFTVTNCGTGLINFNQVLNVAAALTPVSSTFQYGFTEANTLGTLMESEYVASVDAVFALNQELTGSFTSGGPLLVSNFGNTNVDKVFFIQVPPGEAAFTLWSELNSLQTNRPIDQVFNLGNNVWFKSTRSGGTLYMTKIQTTFTNAVTLQR